MWTFLGFATVNTGLSFLFTEKLKKLFKTSSKAANYGVAGVTAAAVPLVVYFGGANILELASAVLGGGDIVIPEPPDEFPVAGYVLTAIMNFFAAGGLYNWIKAVKK